MVKGIINVFDHLEFCLVIQLTMGGNQAVTWPPIIANRLVLLLPLIPGSKYLLPKEIVNFYHWSAQALFTIGSVLNLKIKYLL